MAERHEAKGRIVFSLDAHYRLAISLFIALAVFFVFRNSLRTLELILAVWLGCAVSIIFLNWLMICTTHPRDIRRMAKIQDSSRLFIFLFIVIAAVLSLLAMVLLLKSTKGLPEAYRFARIILSTVSVIISWWLIHTVFAVHYAHMFYDTDTDEGTKMPVGGLEFPGTKEPDYLDFVYFSFVIGMTWQVSDVEISDRMIRRLGLVHGLISWAFNTAIIALTINIISSLMT